MNREAGAIIGIEDAVWILLGAPFVEAVLDQQVVVVGVGEGDHLGPVCHLVGLVFAQKSEKKKRKCWEMISATCALCDSFFQEMV